MADTPGPTDPIGPGPTDREAALDAVLRFVEGLDDNNADLMASAFTADAVADLGGVDPDTGTIQGRTEILSRVLGRVGPLDTTHHISNARVWVSTDAATLTCYALAQHFRPGQGRPPGPHTHLLMGNRYRARLVRDGDQWRIRHIAIVTVWSDGDPTVIQ